MPPGLKAGQYGKVISGGQFTRLSISSHETSSLFNPSGGAKYEVGPEKKAEGQKKAEGARGTSAKKKGKNSSKSPKSSKSAKSSKSSKSMPTPAPTVSHMTTVLPAVTSFWRLESHINL